MRLFAFVLAACIAASTPLRSQEPATHAVLSQEDVRLYRDIFAEQKSSQFAKADAAIAKLSDKILRGYVLLQRYLAPRYPVKLAELKAWLASYSDVAGADRIYKLARRRASAKTALTVPAPIRWRGSPGEGGVFSDANLHSDLGRRTAAKMRSLANDGNPEGAQALLKTVSAGKVPQADADRLASYVAAAYLAEAKDDTALKLAEVIIARGPEAPSQTRWTAGMAAYRMGQFERAAKHFEALSLNGDGAGRTVSGAAYWAARSWMRAGKPEHVLDLYTRAAAKPDTFYGLLAARLLGRDAAMGFAEPALDEQGFARLMQNRAARRAVALWQVGQKETVDGELARAFGEIPADLDPAFAGLARTLGAPAIELRAAELLAERDIRLTSLYPIPPYQPEGGYALDQAVVLAFAKQESRFDTSALSKKGARGVMQILPTTAALIMRDPTLAKGNRGKLDDPGYSLSLGQNYLLDLLERQNGNLLGLAAAYNAGVGNLDRWMLQHESADDPLLFIESLPAPETRDYIKRVMMNMWMYRKRLGQPADGLDDAAAGSWPVYRVATPG